MRTICFAALVLVVVALSSADAGFNLYYQPTVYTEENPIANLILKYTNENVAVLISLKFAGTLLAAGILWGIYRANKRMAWVVVSGVLACEFMIAYYMLM